MTSAILSDEKESLLLKIPPTVNIEVVEDSDEEYDNEGNSIRKASILPSGSLGYSPSTDHFPSLHRLSVPNSHRSSDDAGDGISGGSVASGKRGSFGSERLSICSNLSARRVSSTRILSQSMQQSLKTIRQEQYKLRVAALMERNSRFGKKRRFCECVTMVSGLSTFTAFTLYIIFAHGFTIFGARNPFNMVEPSEPDTRNGIESIENGTIEFVCRTDSHWEWCRWIHLDTYCDFEWVGWYTGDTTKSGNPGVSSIACDFPPGKIEFFGSYDRHECGLRVHHLSVRDRGYWYCEMEKYYLGFDRRYGELSTSKVHVSVVEASKVSLIANTSSLPSSSVSSQILTLNTSSSASSASHPGIVHNQLHKSTNQNASNFDEIKVNDNNANPTNGVIQGISTEEEEYQRQFFLLKVFVLGGVGSVITLLAAIFWAYFMYLWRTLDNSLKRDHVIGGGPGGGVDHAAMAVQEAANQAEMAKELAAIELLNAESGGTQFTTGMLADEMIQVLAGYDLEGGRLPTAFMRSPCPNRAELNIGDRGGFDAINPNDQSDQKRSVSFAPVSNEEDLSRIAEKLGSGGSISPKPPRPDGGALALGPGDVSHLQLAAGGVPIIFPGALLGVGNRGITPQNRQKYGSRRHKKSSSGFPDVASFTRMAKKFKRAAKSKIEERAAGREGGGGTNLASHMASALLTGNVSGSSAEASPSLNPRSASPKKQTSGDFLVPKKSPNVVHGKRDRNDDEGHISHKQITEKGLKSAHMVETKILQEIKIAKSPSTPKVGFDATKYTQKSPDQRKGHRTEALHSEKKKEDTAMPMEEQIKNPAEDISLISEGSHYSSFAYSSPPISEPKLGEAETRLTMKPKLLTEQNDSQQSLSINSRENIDEETAV